jgi:hypothetical protein
MEDLKEWIEKGWRCTVKTLCRKCDSTNVVYRIWESSDGAYEDINYHCLDCGYGWWVDGSDY